MEFIDKKINEALEKEINAMEGITKEDDDFKVDFDKDSVDDIISLVTPTLYQSQILGKIYWFGYKFNDNIDSNTRTQFTKWLKGVAEKKISDSLLKRLIERPLATLDDKVNLWTIDCTVYPKSQRSDLTRSILYVTEMYKKDTREYASFELVKATPKEVEFDWESFNADFTGTQNQYNQIKNYVDNVMLPKIHSLDYFSIAEDVKAKYRKYIRGFLRFGNEQQEKTFKALQGKKILVIDDINTTQSTLNEILKCIKTLNQNDNEIYVFTLLGKE